MKKIKKTMGGMVFFLLELLVGILLLINPVGFTSSIIIGAGVVMICLGTLSISRYFKTEPAQAAAEQNLFHGLLLLLGGIVCATKSSWFLSTFSMLTVLYGLGILISGIAKIQWAVDIFRLKEGKWIMPAISAALSIICGIVVLSSPFGTMTVLWKFTGIVIIAEAVFDMAALFFSRRTAKENGQET